jgi:sugar phosphate isomerase/epimerase
MNPKLAVCNFLEDPARLKELALDHGFSGIDWSFDPARLPMTPSAETQWARQISFLSPIEARFHCPFYQVDLGHDDPEVANRAADLFRRIIRLVSKAGGRFLTIHLGLGHDSTEPLSWEASITNLRQLVHYASDFRVRLCLENLAWGWTSRPNLYEKILRRTGAASTFDMGHAHACESVSSQLYALEDFLTPHLDRILNAHVYHTEISGVGHVPPEDVADIEARLRLLQGIGCDWWVIEIREMEGLLKTKRIVDDYLASSLLNDSYDDFSRENAAHMSK